MANTIFHKLKAQRGITLMELVIALSLTGILMVIFVSGNIFIQKLLSGWTIDNKLAEEGEWILGAVADQIKTCDSLKYNPSRKAWDFYIESKKIPLTFADGRLLSGVKELQGKGFAVTKFDLRRMLFSDSRGDSILNRNERVGKSGLYGIEITLLYRGKTIEFRTAVRNWKEFVNQAN